MATILAHHGLLLNASVAADATALAIYNKLTSYWNMNESSGTRNDSHGTNHLSTVGTTVNTATGVRGPDVAANFTVANTSTLQISNNSSLQVASGGGNHCLFGWVYYTGTSGVQWIGGKWDSSNAANLEYGMSIQSNVAYGQNGGSAFYNASQSPAPSTSTWHFFVMWRDSTDGKVRLQIDNGTVNVSASASNPSPTSNVFAFGRITGVFQLTGRLQMFGWMNNNILTSTERTWLYNSGQGRTYGELATLAGH